MDRRAAAKYQADRRATTRAAQASPAAGTRRRQRALRTPALAVGAVLALTVLAEASTALAGGHTAAGADAALTAAATRSGPATPTPPTSTLGGRAPGGGASGGASGGGASGGGASRSGGVDPTPPTGAQRAVGGADLGTAGPVTPTRSAVRSADSVVAGREVGSPPTASSEPPPRVVYRQAPSRTGIGPDPVPVPPTQPAPPSREMPAGSLFGPASVWQATVAGAPLAPTSAAEVANLVSHVVDRYGGNAAFNAHQYATTFWTADSSTPRVDVAFNNCQGKPYLPPGLLGAGGQFSAVPIPADAFTATGSDHSMSVFSPSTDQLWEFWEAFHTPSGWNACWGGRIDHVSTSPGYFSGGFGSSATGLSTSAGTLTLADVRAGVADHALSLAVPSPRLWNVLSWPAQRSDGVDPSPDAIPEGTRLRLDPSVDVATWPGLSPIARVVARAAQVYGFLVTDNSGAVSVSAESGAVDQAATGIDPWAALEHGVPDYAILTGFPWNRLQAMPKDWGKPTP